MPAIDTALPILWLREWLSEQYSGKLSGARCYVMTQLKHTMTSAFAPIVCGHWGVFAPTPLHVTASWDTLRYARSYSVTDETGRSR